MNKNKFFRQIHIYLSLFFLPMAFIYVISGSAYIFGFNQNIGIEKQIYKFQTKINNGEEKEYMLKFLSENNITIPSNQNVEFNKKEGGYLMGGVHYSVVMNEYSPNNWSLIVKTRSLLGDMIMLHKNKGGIYFTILAIGFSIALILLYISGLMITLFNIKKDRGKQVSALIFGLLITILFAYLSV